MDGFTRIRDEVHHAVRGLTADQLCYRADKEANTIAWLIWHLTRVQDDHVAEVAGHEQVWVAGRWAERFGLDLDVWDTGYGHRAEQVPKVLASADLLRGYHDAVYEKTVPYVRLLPNDAFDRIVDRRWDPPVTLGARLVSVIADDLEHIGQAAFVRGLVERAAASS